MGMSRLLKAAVIFSLVICFLWTLAPQSLCQEKEKVGVLFMHVGTDETYKFDWYPQFFANIFDFLYPGMNAGGPLEGDTCYSLIHYANEAEALACGVSEGTPIDVFCNEYTDNDTYPIHSLDAHTWGGDNMFWDDCYTDPQGTYSDLIVAILSLGHRTLHPIDGTPILGPHVDDPNGTGIGLTDFLEMAAFGWMDRFYRLPGNYDVHRLQAIKWFYGNDAPAHYGFTPDAVELTNIKDELLSNAELTAQYDFVFRNGWEAYMENLDPYGSPLTGLDIIPDSTETAIDELINDEGVDKIVVWQGYPSLANLTQYGHEWYDKNGQGISRIPGKTFKECVEDITDAYGPENQTKLDDYLYYKPWSSHEDHPWPLIKHLVNNRVELLFAPGYGKYPEYDQAVYDMLEYTVNSYSIPASSNLKVVLVHHGYFGAFMDAQECDIYYDAVEEMGAHVMAHINDPTNGFVAQHSWAGTFEVVHAYGEYGEGESSNADPNSPAKPEGDLLSAGEAVDLGINGQWVNSQGELIDNGDNNFDYIVVIPYFFDVESSDTNTFGLLERTFGNRIPPDYDRDDKDADGTDYDAGDINSEYFCVKTMDATGWPSIPSVSDECTCTIGEPGCDCTIPIPSNPEWCTYTCSGTGETEYYKGSATNPTTVIVTGTISSLGNSSARTNLTTAAAKAIIEALEDETVIRLESFDAKADNKAITLKWVTASEIDNAGFNLYRAEAGGDYVKINTALIPAAGSPSQGASYELVDRGLKNGVKYLYLLEDVDVRGAAEKHGPVSATPRWIYVLLP